jgi:radical SAM/Cys-rich protein
LPHSHDFQQILTRHDLAPLCRAEVTTLQVNIGLRCNLACHHCHVESGPKRSEAMGRREVVRILELLESNPRIEVLDVTGGAPELSDQFRFLVRGARALGRRVIDRCNLTVFFEVGQEDTPEFLAEHEVEIVASLPCYTLENVEAQRGRGVFVPSIEALQRLNALGYGRVDSPLRLDLVYNPGGAFLPPAQAELEAQYREELHTHFGIEFHRLITITNMPIKRFARDLSRAGQESKYLSLLADHFNPATVEGLMCRSTLSIDHTGRFHDCDFNLALGIEVSRPARTIFDVEDLSSFEGNDISTGPHCLGCTAGAGSSCGGAIVEASAQEGA